MSKQEAPTTKFSNIWNPIMLVLIFFIVFIVSIFPESWHQLLFSISYTFLFISAGLTVAKHRGLMLAVVGIVLGMEWISTVIDIGLMNMISRVLNFVFFAFMSGYYIHLIAKARKVTPRVIFQAIIGYLLLGLVFSIMITMLVEYNPAMFSFPFASEPGTGTHFSDYLYYGFVTLTTLGYGDIVPLLPFSKSLSILVSVSGQLYLAIIVAMLVGKFASQRD